MRLNRRRFLTLAGAGAAAAVGLYTWRVEPRPEPTPDAELVPVLATGDAGLIAIAQSLLDAEKIDYLLRGDGLQDLFGAGRLTGYSFAMGPAEFLVRSEDAARARELLDGLTARDPPHDA
jgi:hypothetical protein